MPSSPPSSSSTACQVINTIAYLCHYFHFNTFALAVGRRNTLRDHHVPTNGIEHERHEILTRVLYNFFIISIISNHNILAFYVIVFSRLKLIICPSLSHMSYMYNWVPSYLVFSGSKSWMLMIPSTAMILTMSNKEFLVLPEEEFQLPVSYQCGRMT